MCSALPHHECLKVNECARASFRSSTFTYIVSFRHVTVASGNRSSRRRCRTHRTRYSTIHILHHRHTSVLQFNDVASHHFIGMEFMSVIRYAEINSHTVHKQNVWKKRARESLKWPEARAPRCMLNGCLLLLSHSKLHIPTFRSYPFPFNWRGNVEDFRLVMFVVCICEHRANLSFVATRHSCGRARVRWHCPCRFIFDY